MIELYLFQTPRLRIRRLHAADTDALFRVYGDREAMRWVGDGEPLTREQCMHWVTVTENNYAIRGYGMSAVERITDGAVIGFCGLVHPGGQPEPEAKYAYDRTCWGQGYASEALRGLLDWGFTVLQLQRIIATAYPQNTASVHVLMRAGMRHLEDRQDEDVVFGVYEILPASR